MANIRIKDLANTASSTASDDFIGIDGATNGTRKLNAYSPSFGGNATVAGTLTVSGGSVTLTGAAYSIFYADGSSGGNFTIRKAGVAYGTLYGNETNTVLDSAGSANLILQTGGATRGTFTSSGLTVNATTASTSTSTGALVVGNGSSGGLGVGGAINAGGTLTVNGKIRNDPNTSISGDVAGSISNLSATGYGLRVQGGASGSGYILSANDYTGSEKFQIAGSGNATFAGNTNAFGAGGTGGANSQLILEGGSAANGGGAILYRKNGTVKAYAGMESSILGGGSTSDNYIIYTSSGLALTVAGQQVQANATTASTSTSTGALVVGNGTSGGLGVGGALYVGSKGQFQSNDDALSLKYSTDGGACLLAWKNTSGTTLWSIGGGIDTRQDELVFRRTTTTVLNLDSSNNATFAGNIKTAAPAGGTAAAWKLGAVASVSPTSPNRTIEVDIGGTIYYIHAKTTND